MLERFRVGQRAEVLHRAVVHYFANREFDDFARLGAWNFGHLDYARGYVAWRAFGAHGLTNLLAQRVVEFETGLQCDEQNHAHVVVPVLTDDNALDDLVELLDVAIYLSGADAHATGVQRGVGATVNDDAVVFGERDIIAVMPDVVEARKVGVVVLLPSRVGPEVDRLAGESLGADQLALFAAHRLAIVVKYVDRHAERAALDFTAIHRAQRAAHHETGNDIGTAGDRGQADIFFDVFVNEIETLGRQYRAGRCHRAQRGQVELVDRVHLVFFHRIDVFGRGAENIHIDVVGVTPQNFTVRVKG